MSGVNKALILGNVGKDPESRKAGESTVCSFSVATSEKYKDKETTEWHNIVCWNKLAEVVMQYVKKGSKVFVEGKITNRSWDDDKGIKHYRTEIVAQSVQFLSSRNDSGGGGGDPGPSPDNEGVTEPF